MPLRSALVGVATAVMIAASPAPGRSPKPVIGPDAPAITPIARPGTAPAARSGLGRGELQGRLARALASDGSAGGAWVYDTEAGGDAVLFSENASKRRVPASNQKLLTTAALLSKLGADARLQTRAFVRGRRSGRGRSVLNGDLVVVGDGDPAFGTARFARDANQPVTRVATLARKVARAGVERITGRILADDTIFDRKRRRGPYLSPLSGLSFNNGYDGGGYARAPELLAVKALKAALRKRGVKVGGKVGRANLSATALDREPLAAVASPTVAKLIEETNVPSNNFFAEMLLKRLAATSGKKGTRRRGNAKVEAFAESVGIRARAADGSGLSRDNRVAPGQLGRLLVAMAGRSADAAAFRDSLPVAGREGTVADRMRGTAAQGNCRTKTGTLSDASALSGYCEAGNHTIAFSILMNDANVDAARRAQDEMAAAIARYDP